MEEDAVVGDLQEREVNHRLTQHPGRRRVITPGPQPQQLGDGVRYRHALGEYSQLGEPESTRVWEQLEARPHR